MTMNAAVAMAPLAPSSLYNTCPPSSLLRFILFRLWRAPAPEKKEKKFDYRSVQRGRAGKVGLLAGRR
jgi:hypothetical protein